jgi:hypothetical protein
MVEGRDARDAIPIGYASAGRYASITHDERLARGHARAIFSADLDS